MSIEYGGRLFSNLSDPIYANNKQIKEIWIRHNDEPTMIYPMEEPSDDYYWYVRHPVDSDQLEFHVVANKSSVPTTDDIVLDDVLPRDGFAINQAEADATGRLLINTGKGENTFDNVYRLNIKSIHIDEPIKPRSMRGWFFGFTYPSYIECYNFHNIDMSECKSIGYIFYNWRLQSDSLIAWLNGLDVSNVEDFSYTFYNNGYYSTALLRGISDDLLDAVSRWDMSSAKDVSGMFRNCYVKNSNMFRYFQNWDVSSIEDFSYMFHGLQLGGGLSSINLEGSYLGYWKPRSAKNFSYMFFFQRTTVKILSGSDLSGGLAWKNVVSGVYEYYRSSNQVLGHLSYNCDLNNDWSLYIPQSTKEDINAFRYMFMKETSTSGITDRFLPAWFFNQSGNTNDAYDPTYDVARAEYMNSI